MPLRVNYSLRFRYPDPIERGVLYTLQCLPSRSGSVVEPTSGTCTVYDASNNVVDTGAVTTSATLGATFDLAAAKTDPDLVTNASSGTLGTGWRTEWALVMPDGNTHTARNPAALARHTLYPVLTLDDLQGDEGYSDLARYADAAMQQAKVDTAWWRIQRRLFQDERRPWLVIEPSALLDVHRELALALIFQDVALSGPEDGRWANAGKNHMSNFQREWRSLTFLYDAEDTGKVTEAERRSAAPYVVFGAMGIDRRF